MGITPSVRCWRRAGSALFITAATAKSGPISLPLSRFKGKGRGWGLCTYTIALKKKKSAGRCGASGPPAEVILWPRLRGEQVSGWKFRRQYSVGPYVLDFYCPRLKLAIEIDGPTHDGDEACVYDANRQAFIECHGITFLRFRNERVYWQLDAVIETIAATAEKLANPEAQKEREKS